MEIYILSQPYILRLLFHKIHIIRTLIPYVDGISKISSNQCTKVIKTKNKNVFLSPSFIFGIISAILCPDNVSRLCLGKIFFDLAKQYTPETKWPPLSPVTGGRNLWIMGGEIYRVPEKYTPLLVQSSIQREGTKFMTIFTPGHNTVQFKFWRPAK